MLYSQRLKYEDAAKVIDRAQSDPMEAAAQKFEWNAKHWLDKSKEEGLPFDSHYLFASRAEVFDLCAKELRTAMKRI